MKVLWLLLAVLAGVWLWRSGRSDGPTSSGSAPARNQSPQVMVPCTLCQLHVPIGDAVAGHRGSYCCAAHRLQAEP